MNPPLWTRRALRLPALLAVLLAASLIGACADGDETQGGDRAERTTPTTQRADPPRPEERPKLARTSGTPTVETLATGLEVPWDLAFLPDGRALVTERPGRLRLMSAGGDVEPEPVAEIRVSAQGEGGLLGVAVDPRFEANSYVYLYYTAGPSMELARFRFEGGRLEREATLLDDIVAGPIHDSGRIHFGPDERLYVATGDAGQPALAQDKGSPNGKFLRLGPRQYRRRSGGRAEVVSVGHRNPQGFDWEPKTGRLIASEHGETGNDEINAIERGKNYGWPEAQGADHSGFTAPLVLYEETIAPSGATFVELPRSEWSGDFIVAALAGEQLRRVRLDGGRARVDEALFEGRFGRLRTVVEGPDGALYALTSNRDGRGDPTEDDDRILRIVPPAG